MTATNDSRWTQGVTRRVFGNGLTALAAYDPDAPAVAVVLHVRAGFFDEPDRWQGISHVLEHMFFKGTPTRGVGQIAADTKALGGYLNASTSYDGTSYYVVLPAAGFREALAIQADALKHAAIDGGELGRELQVIIEEAKRKLDTPSAVAQETVHALLFDRHRVRRWRIGTEEGLRAFTRDDVVGYYQSRYVPERIVVSVVGAVPVPEALTGIESEFGSWQKSSAPIEAGPEEPWRTGLRVRTLRGDVKQAELVIGWRGVAHLDTDAAPLDIAAMVLSSGRGSWLYRALRNPGLVTSAMAYHYSPLEVGVFAVSADLAPSQVPEALTTVGGLVAELRENGPGEADLARVKTMLTAQMARRFESVDGRAASFAGAEALGGVGDIDREFARLQAVTAADVRRVARRYLGSDAAGVVLYLPKGTGPDLEATTVATALAAAPGPPPPTPAAPAPSPPAAGPVAIAREKAQVHVVALPGVDLLIRRKASVPLVTVGFYRRRRLADPAARAGVAALAVRASARGAGPYGAGQLADQFESLGGTLGTSVAADWLGVGATVLAARWPEAAALLREVFWRPRLEAAEVLRERDTQLNEVVQAADDMFRRPVDLALEAAFGDRGYGLPVKGFPDSVARLTTTDVADWHRDEMAGGRATVTVVGDVDPADVAARLATLLTELPVAESLPRPASAEWTRVAAERIESRAKSQTALAMVFPGPARNDPDRHAAEVLAAVASGLGGRLFSALRDKRSLAYTVLMASWQRLGAGAILTYIATSPDREDEARSAMLAELARFRTDGVTDDELSRAVNFLAGQALVQRQTAGAVAAEITDAWLIGGGLDELEDPTAPYRAVTRDAVREVAARWLDGERRAEGVVRGGG